MESDLRSKLYRTIAFFEPIPRYTAFTGGTRDERTHQSDFHKTGDGSEEGSDMDFPSLMGCRRVSLRVGFPPAAR